MRHAVAILLLSTLVAIPALSQEIGITRLDPSAFPIVSANIILLGTDLGQPLDINSADLEITEDGRPVSDLAISCPPTTTPRSASVLLLIDGSGSMNSLLQSGVPRVVMIRSALRSLLTALVLDGGTTLAVTLFNALPQPLIGFTSDSTQLGRAFDAITADGATEYTPALLDPLVGGIEMLASRSAQLPRVLIFVSDGQPNTPFDPASAIARAQAANVTIHTITIGDETPPELRQLALQSGGIPIGNVNDEVAARSALLLAGLAARGLAPCRVTWQSPQLCPGVPSLRRVVVRHIPTLTTSHAEYIPPASRRPTLVANQAGVWFGTVPSGSIVDSNVTITAIGGDITVASWLIPIGAPFTVVSWGGISPPFTLQQGTSRTIQVRHTATDAGESAVLLALETLPCSSTGIALSAGRDSGEIASRLRIISPVGGDDIDGCNDVLVQWGGVQSATPIAIDISSDNGATWGRVADSATGLARSIALPPGRGYRIRISVATNAADTIIRIAGGGISGDGGAALDANLSAPTGIARQGRLLYIAESSGNRVRRVDLASGIISTIAGTGAPGYSNDGAMATSARLANPNDVAIDGSSLYIADYSNHRIRRVDLASGIISTIAGTGASGFSGDGGIATSATLASPSHLALYNGLLYFSDRANNRVRVVNLTSGIITTVAGGGVSSGVEGIVATAAALRTPAGIAVIDDTLFITAEGGNRLRSVSLVTGLIRTYAGTGTPGNSGDGMAAINAQMLRPTGLDVYGELLYLSDEGNNAIRVINRSSGIIRHVAGRSTAGYSGDGEAASTAALNAPEGVDASATAVYIADVGNGVVRRIALAKGAGSDSSRSAFTVSAPLLRPFPATRISLANTAVGTLHDTLLTTLICNDGDRPLVIDSLVVISGDTSAFQILPAARRTIEPGQCLPLEVRFKPTVTGPHSARIAVVSACGGSDTLELHGTGEPSCGITVTTRIDLGLAIIGIPSTDTTITQAICNHGIDTARVSVSAMGDVEIVAGAGNIILPPGMCHNLRLRLMPRSEGVVAGRIVYTGNPVCGEAATLVVGRAEQRGVMSVPEVTPLNTACEDDVDTVVVILRNSGTSDRRATSAEFVPTSSSFTLLGSTPSASLPWLVRSNDSIELRVAFSSTTVGTENVVLRIEVDGEWIDVPIAGSRDSVGVSSGSTVVLFDGRLAAGAYPLRDSLLLYNTGTRPVSITSATPFGGDAAAFTVPSGIFPALLDVGDSVTVMVDALAPATDSSVESMLVIEFDPSCSGVLRVPIFERTAAAAILLSPVVFPPIHCNDRPYSLARGTLTNAGGDTLVVDGFTLSGDNPDHFIVDTLFPIVVPPGTSIRLPIRFVRLLPGSSSATLNLRSNGEGNGRLLLTGVRRRLSLMATPEEIIFTDGAAARQTLLITNTGDVAVAISPSLLASTSLFTIDPNSPFDLSPGDTVSLDIVADTTAVENAADTLLLIDSLCGVVLRIPITRNRTPRITSVISLPTDSGRAGDLVIIPIRVSAGHPAPLDYGFTLRVDGTVLDLESISQGSIVARRFDRQSGIEEIDIDGTWHGNDTLLLLRARAMVGGRTHTELAFTNFDWDSPSITDSTIDGAFALEDSCVVIRGGTPPTVTSITPSPATNGTLQVEFMLEEDATIRLELVDDRGVTILRSPAERVISGGRVYRMDVGEVASGGYWVVVRSAFGVGVGRVIVVR